VQGKKQMIPISNDARGIYEQLYSQVSLLTFNWLTYKKLFSVDQEQIDLLDRTGRSFFQAYHDTLLNDVLLSLSRITDNPKSAKGARISLRRLLLHLDLNVDPVFTSKFKTLIEQAEQDCVPVRQHRNKQVAHLSLDTVVNSRLNPLPDLNVKQIDDALGKVQKALILYSLTVLDESHLFEPIQAVRDATSLLFFLQRGLKCIDEDHEGQLSKSPCTAS
jgi:hypothetical protein